MYSRCVVYCPSALVRVRAFPVTGACCSLLFVLHIMIDELYPMSISGQKFTEWTRDSPVIRFIHSATPAWVTYILIDCHYRSVFSFCIYILLYTYHVSDRTLFFPKDLDSNFRIVFKIRVLLYMQRNCTCWVLSWYCKAYLIPDTVACMCYAVFWRFDMIVFPVLQWRLISIHRLIRTPLEASFFQKDSTEYINVYIYETMKPIFIIYNSLSYIQLVYLVMNRANKRRINALLEYVDNRYVEFMENILSAVK